MKLSKLKPNPRNPRIIRDDKFKKLVESLRSFPEMMEKRPMVCVTDVDGRLFPLGGNMRLRAIQEIGMKDIPDTWVMIADDWTEDKRREFTIKDNVGFGEWDWDELANEWDSGQLEEWGLDVPSVTNVDEKDLFDIELPFYEPSSDCPNESELVDMSRYNDLIDLIDKTDATTELKTVLKARAAFFCDFDFDKIADYYAHSSKDVKDVIKSLGLVVLAPKEAVESGFVELSEMIEL